MRREGALTGRSHSLDRCARCRLRPALCVCDELPALRLATRVVVVVHRFEERLTTNTGRLASLALTNSALLVRGDPSRPIASSDVDDGRATRLVLFPSDDAVTLDLDFVARIAGPITLIVPDGNWRQTRRTIRREATLAGATRVKLAPGGPSRYRLRCGTREDGLATLEAVARALGVLEGVAVQRSLEALFTRVVERTLWSRGWLPLESCRASIPDAAVAEARASGRHTREASSNSPTGHQSNG